MNPSPLGQFPSLKVLVIGDAMLDVYLRGQSSRICQEAPVPIVECSGRAEAPGGAANTAINLRALGAQVALLTAVGQDEEGRRLVETIQRTGVDTRHIIAVPQRRTLCKQRVLAGSQLVVRLDQGDTGPLDEQHELPIADSLSVLLSECDAVVLSDYHYGVIGQRVIAELAHQRRSLPPLIGDSKCLARLDSLPFLAVKPNYCQAIELLGLAPLEGPARVEQMLARGGALLDRLNTQIAALTLDRDGAIIFERGTPPQRTFTSPNPHSQAAGAGDTFVAALTLALAAGGTARQAAEIAAAAAAIVVAREGTSHCTWQELHERLSGREIPDISLAGLLPRLAEHRRHGRRVVLTSGCFDILHRGHITYLSQARNLGDVLVVGLNTDESIRRLKGPQRPINSLEDRVQVLSALSCVNHVVAFDEDTPHGLVRAVRPDVFVKGGDYTRDRLPEAALVEELGGRVEILPLVGERSTTRLISRIRAADGPNGRHVPLPPAASTTAQSVSVP